jgi:hypothetical protein
VERAKFGYQLLDDLFDDDAAGEMLDALDSFSDTVTKRNTEGLGIFFVGLFGSDDAARSLVTGDPAANVCTSISTRSYSFWIGSSTPLNPSSPVRTYWRRLWSTTKLAFDPTGSHWQTTFGGQDSSER